MSPAQGSAGEEYRMEERAQRARGVDALFPVCISCVFKLKLRARACFLCVMGARPPGLRHKDNTPEEPADVSNRPGSR